MDKTRANQKHEDAFVLVACYMEKLDYIRSPHSIRLANVAELFTPHYRALLIHHGTLDHFQFPGLGRHQDVELEAVSILKMEAKAMKRAFDEEVAGREDDVHLRDGQIGTLRAKARLVISLALQGIVRGPNGVKRTMIILLSCISTGTR